ncbi:hypothetical protein CBD41_01485, partial [bacterium TMED181]
LGHQVFILRTGVRIPLGSLKYQVDIFGYRPVFLALVFRVVCSYRPQNPFLARCFDFYGIHTSGIADKSVFQER